MKLLKVLFALELLAGALWVFPVLFDARPGMELLPVVFFSAPLHLACMTVGGWALLRRPDHRRWGLLVAVTPPVLLVLPLLLRDPQGLPLLHGVSSTRWVAAALLSPLALCLLLPHKVAGYVPAALFRNRLLHYLPTALTALMLAGYGLLAWYLVTDPLNGSLQPVLAPLFLLGLWAPVLAVPAALFDWVGLFQKSERGLHPVRVVGLGLALSNIVGSALLMGYLAAAVGSG